MGDWIAISALIVSILVGLLSYIRSPAFVSASRTVEQADVITELRGTIADMRDEIAALKLTVAASTARVAALMSECEWWRDQYRRLKSLPGPP